MKLKRIKTLFILLLCSILIASLAGCEPDDGDDFTLPRDQYLGQWSCQDSDNVGYMATITSDPLNSTQVIIHNFSDYKGTVTAIVTSGSIEVGNQKMQGVPGTYWCSGVGTYSQKSGKTTINWSPYSVNGENLTSVYTKQ